MFKTLDNGDRIAFDGTYYDFRDADGRQMIKLWIPSHRPVRGLFISGHGGGTGDSRDFARDLNFRAFAARLGFAVAGLHTFPGRKVYESGGKVFFDALNEFAALGHHPELANVPFCIFGSSNGGSTSYGFTNYAPERAICFVANVCSWFNPEEPVDAALQVPGMIIVGIYDPFGRGSEGVARATAQVKLARSRGGRWSLIAAQKGHEDGYAFDVYVKLVEQCVALRYPDSEDPAKGPVTLKDIPEDQGWLVDQDSWASGLTRVAPYADYEGDKAIAGWVPTEAMARIYCAAATYDPPLSLSIDGVEAVHNPHIDPGTMFSIGGPVVEPGRDLRLVADTWELGEWESITFYEGARAVGEVKAPSAAEFTVPASTDDIVCCFTAQARTPDGRVRTSRPFYAFVRDPEIPLAVPGEGDAGAAYTDPVGKVGSQAKPLQSEAPLSAGPVLQAPGLTVEQESQFGAQDGVVSPFWEGIESQVQMNPRENGAAESKFSIVNTADARLTMKAAHSARGMYLYLEVADDHFVECNPDRYYDTDAIDLLIDSRSSAEVTDQANNPELINQFWGLSLTTKQVHVAFGDRKQPPFFLLNYADPWDFTQHRHTFQEAREQLGIEIRIIRRSPMVRIQEWFLPWAEVGNGGLECEPAIGSKLAFAIGYNDIDPGSELVKKLRLVDGTSPWQFGAKDEAPRGWGDIQVWN